MTTHEPTATVPELDTVRVAIDVGGTFVDAISFEPATRRIRTFKAPTTPSRPSTGVLAAIGGLGYEFSTIGTIVHGTTLGLNSILQRRGARVGLITTEGFEDVLEIARADVPSQEMYNFAYVPPPPLVARRWRVGVRERIDAEGEIVVPLREDEVVRVAGSLVSDGCEAIAVCFLHSYVNSRHEKRASELLRSTVPGIPVSCSVDVARQYREYERTTTTVLDAFIRPVLEEYFGEIEGALRAQGFRGDVHVMRSSGGAMTLELARQAPLSTVLSGPAGGIAGAAWISRGLSTPQVLSFDVGGTSADTCVLEDAVPHHAYESHIDHLPLLMRVFDIRTIGAGGGSIAHGERAVLRVGPESAGAVPGPASYDRGGLMPTVTDAALFLGLIAEKEFLDGRMPLSLSAARLALESVAKELGLDVVRTAAGIIQVAIAKTVGSLREITTERGLDPREFSLLCFGGAGPLLGALVAGELGIATTVIPVTPALFSAWGMLTTDLEYDVSRSVLVPLSTEKDVVSLRQVIGALGSATVEALRGQEEEAAVTLHPEIEVRYRGQEYGLHVPLSDEDRIEDLRLRFAALHELRHGHGIPEDMEVVACRVRGVLKVGKPEVSDLDLPTSSPGGSQVGLREAYDFSSERMVQTAVHRRELLAPGSELVGPAIVIEGTSTTVVPRNHKLTVAESGVLVIRARS